MKEWKLQEITYKVVKERRYEVAVLPVGSTEPHGLHIPYGSDALHGERIAERVCEYAHNRGAAVVLLPTIPYGVNSNMKELPLAIDVRQSTLNRLLKDIVRSLEGHGVRKVVIFNSHGGNDFKPFLRDMYGRTCVFLSSVDWWRVASDVSAQVFDQVGDHADAMETSVGLELFGDLIHLEDADDGAVRPMRIEALKKGWAVITRPWHTYTRNAGAGNPAGASREKGKQIIDCVVERIGNYLKDLAEAELDEWFPFVPRE